jgi:hypothetical protein
MFMGQAVYTDQGLIGSREMLDTVGAESISL